MEKPAEENNSKGLVFNIQRYSLHDGPGIRTLIFMKGCPLECLWCSNPESQSGLREIGFVRSKCSDCGNCAEVCPQNAIEKNLFTDKSKCVLCGRCVDICPSFAREFIGNYMTVGELANIVNKDNLFYKNSGGGVTVGGGEPLYQSEFVSLLLAECKQNNIHTAVETCGFATWDKLAGVLENTDILLYDIKHMDAEAHQKLTGTDNEEILKNAERAGTITDMIIRIPLIPNLNDSDENLKKTYEFALGIKRLSHIEVLPYHNLGRKKYDWVSKKYALDHMKPYLIEDKEKLRDRLEKLDLKMDVV